MTVLYPNSCFNGMCYKGTALFQNQEKTGLHDLELGPEVINLFFHVQFH